MRDCIKDLLVFFKSKINCIWIRSYEETEVIKDIKELVKTEPILSGVNIQLWSRTEGITNLALNANEIQGEPNTQYREFPAMFAYMSNIQNNRSTLEEGGSSKNLWILRDFHTVITDARAQRYIRDLKEYDSDRYNPIIIISPVLELPDDISKLFRVIEYDLPTKDMIRETILIANETLVIQERRAPGEFKPIKEEEVETYVNALTGLTLYEIKMLLKESMIRFHTFNLEFLLQDKIETVKKTGALDYKIPKITLDDIGGNEVIKEWLHENKALFSEEAKKFHLDKPKGFVAVGVAGCGKTAIAEAFAGMMGYPLLELSVSKIMDRLVGSSEKKIVHALQVAKSCAPCVLLLDEVEKMFGGVNSSNQSDSGITARVFQEILKFMNNNNSGVYVIMTSNDISQLPPEFTRAGRLDCIWYFGLPNEEERRNIFNIHFKKKEKNTGDVILDEAVRLSEGYTGAEIQQVVNNVMRISFSRYLQDGNEDINIDDIAKAVNEVIPVSRSSKEKILALQKYCKTRARSTSKEINNTVNKEKSNELFSLDWSLK